MKETTTTDGRTDRRTYLKLVSAGALTASVAGCLGLGGDSPDNQAGNSTTESDSGGGTSGNSGADNGGANTGTTEATTEVSTAERTTTQTETTEASTTETTTTETSTPERTATQTETSENTTTMAESTDTTTGNSETTTEDRGNTPAGNGTATVTDKGTPSPKVSIRPPKPNEMRDWDTIAMQNVDPFSVPEKAPTAFSFFRFGNKLTISYGSLAGSPTVKTGTLYVIFVGSEGVMDVLVWETPITYGEQFTVGPAFSALELDTDSIEAIAFAWENESGIYLAEKEESLFS